jgi:hypothetical protein
MDALGGGTMSIEAMKLALEALEKCEAALAEELSAWDIDPPLHHVQESHDLCGPAITSLRQAIAEAETQEPVEYDIRCDNCGGDGYDPKDNNYSCSTCEGAGFLEKLFYTAPQPKRELPNLTVDELIDLEQKHRSHESLSRAIEAKLKEKNT